MKIYEKIIKKIWSNEILNKILLLQFKIISIIDFIYFKNLNKLH